ncbi:MAG: hypothetical protein ABFD83_10125 [Armatimonadota bacterium]
MGPGPDALSLASSLAKSVEIDRSPGVTQRASDIAQDQITAEDVAALSLKKTDALEQLRRDKIRQDREQRRRELERHMLASDEDETVQDDGESHLDAVA